MEENAEELHIGDDVIITGPVKYQGSTGVIDSFGRNKSFVVVNLYNHCKHSFHSSDVEFNDYAGSEEEEAELNRRGERDFGLFGDDDRDDDDDTMREDPTQQELTVEPPTPPTKNPTLPESQLVRTLALEDGTVMEIHGSAHEGYEIRRGDRRMRTRFPDLALAETLLDLYRARHQHNQGDQDYVEER